MRYIKMLGIVVFFLMSMSSAAAEETSGETDACLVTLYNYPADTPQYSVSKKTLPKTPLVLEKNKRASKTSESIHSRMSLPQERPGDK